MSKQNNLRVYEPDTPQYRFYKEQHAKQKHRRLQNVQEDENPCKERRGSVFCLLVPDTLLLTAQAQTSVVHSSFRSLGEPTAETKG